MGDYVARQVYFTLRAWPRINSYCRKASNLVAIFAQVGGNAQMAGSQEQASYQTPGSTSGIRSKHCDQTKSVGAFSGSSTGVSAREGRYAVNVRRAWRTAFVRMVKCRRVDPEHLAEFCWAANGEHIEDLVMACDNVGDSRC
jgi:hypothetical protein